jgi:hypothetical protein
VVEVHGEILVDEVLRPGFHHLSRKDLVDYGSVPKPSTTKLAAGFAPSTASQCLGNPTPCLGIETYRSVVLDALDTGVHNSVNCNDLATIGTAGSAHSQM